MTYKLDSSYIGYPALEGVTPVPASLQSINPTPGFLARAEDPVWGPGEFLFGRAGATIRLFALCVLTPVWDATNKVFTQNFTECPNTANLGRPVYVAQAVGAAVGSAVNALTVGQYGWFLDSGVTPINGTATVAADTAFGITAAGQIGANTAGKQIVNGRIVTAATQTVVSAGTGFSGDTKINLASTQGFFPGGYLSGTGVGASAIVQYVDPLGNFIIASVANTAAIASNVTVTYNNATIFYNVAQLDRAFAQGAIT